MPFASDSELSECLSKDLPIVASGNTTIPCCNILQFHSTNLPTVLLYKLSTAGPRVKRDFAKCGCTVLGLQSHHSHSHSHCSVSVFTRRTPKSRNHKEFLLVKL